MAELAQQRARLVHRSALRRADPCRQGRWHLGAQRNSQSARFTRRRGDETALGGGRRRRHVQEHGGVLDGPRHRAVDGQAVPRAVVRRHRNPVPLRFDPEQAAPRRRDPDRPHAVGTQGHRRHPRGDRGALPPLLPPGVRLVSHGFRVAPNSRVSVNDHSIISGTVVLPTMTAPAARSLRTTSASSVLAGPYAPVPYVVTSPATSTSSLIAIGTPSSGERSPVSRRACAAAASSRAGPASTTRYAPQRRIQPGDAVEVEVEQCGCGDRARGEQPRLFRGAGEG